MNGLVDSQLYEANKIHKTETVFLFVGAYFQVMWSALIT